MEKFENKLENINKEIIHKAILLIGYGEKFSKIAQDLNLSINAIKAINENYIYRIQIDVIRKKRQNENIFNESITELKSFIIEQLPLTIKSKKKIKQKIKIFKNKMVKKRFSSQEINEAVNKIFNEFNIYINDVQVHKETSKDVQTCIEKPIKDNKFHEISHLSTFWEEEKRNIIQPFLQNKNTNPLIIHEVLDIFDSNLEGKKKYIQSIIYERNPKNREIALKKHNRICKACGFDFNDFYGKDLAKDFIEVHHIKPVSEGVQEINPETDLIPLCSNCHSMIHREAALPSEFSEIENRYKKGL